MRVNPVNNTSFKQVVETFRKDSNKNKENNNETDTYEVTITWTETIKVPKGDKTLQHVDYMI